MKVLKFYAEWCEPCNSLSMAINSAADKISIPIEEINIDKEINIAIEYGVRSVPTVILLDENNTELKRKVGAMTELQLLDFLKV